MTDFDADAVPKELRERDQWICWESSTRNGKATKIPKDPNGGGNAKSNDSKTWSSFEKAVETAEERGWGLGFVFTPVDPFVGVDIDSCLNDDGRAKDWSTEIGLGPFLHETFVETSPSGTGLHVYIEGEIPDWWTNVDRDTEDGHEGVEVYDNGRFFTITGDTTEFSKNTVKQIDEFEGWLKSAWREFNDSGAAEPWDEAKVASAGSSTNHDANSGDEINVDIYDVLQRGSYPEGERRSHPCHGSDTGTNFHVDDDAETFRCWRHDCTGNALHIVGMQEGIISCGEWDGVGLGSDTWSEIFDAARDRGLDVGEKKTPDSGQEPVVEEEGEERTLPSPREFSVDNGHYGTWEEYQSDGNTEWYFETWTNFQIEVNSYLKIEDTTHIDVTVHPARGDSYDVTVEPTVFNEVRDFKAEICSGLTATFEGGQEELNAIKRFVGTQDAPYRDGTHHMGLHHDEWVTPKGVLGPEGWTDDPEHVYVERGIGSERKWKLGPDSGSDFDREEVRKTLELLPQTRETERLLPLIGWFYSAPLRPLIQQWTGQFNLMFVQGDTGSGKTTTVSTMWEAFGMEGDPLTADDTKFTLITTLGSSNAVPMWFDEYKPSDMADYEVDRFWNEVRKTTRGGVAQRGNADKTTTEYHLRAPTVISGEERVAGAAEERRGIFTTFRKDSTEPGSETARAYAKLAGGDVRDGGEVEYYDGVDLQQHALAYYRFILAQNQEDLRALWREAGDDVAELLSEIDVVLQEDLVEQGLQTVMFGAKVYEELAEKVGADTPVSEGDVEDAIEYVATRSQGGANRKSHLDTFFELSARAASHDYLIEGEHYTFVKEGQADEELRMNLATSFDKVSRYARDHEVAEDLLNSKSDYYERIRDLVEDPTSYVVTASQPTPGINRAVGINRLDIEDALDDFEKSMFTDVDDGEGIDATRIRNLQPGYDTITAEVLSIEGDLPEQAPDGKATLRDSSGAIDCISWDGTLGVDEGGCYVFKTALVGNSPDGAQQIQVVDGVTEINEIQQGAGHTGQAQTEDGQGDLDVVADGGEHESLRGRIATLLHETGGEFTKAELAGKLSDDPAMVQEALDRLAERGEIDTLPDGKYTIA